MAKKGITPIIAIIVLLLIVVALAGLAYTYIFGIITGQIEGSFLVQPGGLYCENTSQGNKITIIIRNTGTSGSLSIDDFLIKQVGNSTYTWVLNTTEIGSVPPQETKTMFALCNGTGSPSGWGCPSGTVRVQLATGATPFDQTVICP